MNKEAIGTWEDVFGGAAPKVQELAQALRSRIRTLHPAAIEVARPGDKAVSFGHGPKKMSEAYAYVMPQRGWVNLGFYSGARLADPCKLLEGTGKSLRHVKIFSRSMAESADIDTLLLEAMAERRLALGGE